MARHLAFLGLTGIYNCGLVFEKRGKTEDLEKNKSSPSKGETPATKAFEPGPRYLGRRVLSLNTAAHPLLHKSIRVAEQLINPSSAWMNHGVVLTLQ